MWVMGVVMMVVLCFGGLVGTGFSMHKHGVGKDAQAQTTKDSQKPVHEHGNAADCMQEDKNNGTHQHMMQMEQQDTHGNGAPAEGSGDGKGIAKEKEM